MNESVHAIELKSKVYFPYYAYVNKSLVQCNLNICCWHLSPAAHFFQLSPKDLYIWGFKPSKENLAIMVN